ncbi:MAG: hypothetical protein JW981_07500 [Anaerolineae bacterium]|nr:hypothetical protein [Anaerolineae bacterium]
MIKIWEWLNSKILLTITLIILLTTLLLSLIIPQAPNSTADNASFSRWLAEIYPRFGQQTNLLATTGLLTLRTSLWLRVVLGILGLLSVAHTSTLLEKWEEYTQSKRGLEILISAGSILILIGWSIQTLWGWTEPNLTVWPDEPVIISKHNINLPPPGKDIQLLSNHYGLYLFPDKGTGASLEIQAYKNSVPLELLTSTHSTPQNQLRITLTTQEPDAYFVSPTEGLGFRVNLKAATAEPQLQIYRIASGELITETAIQDNIQISEANIEMRLVKLPYMKVKIVYNPGAPVLTLGLLLLSIGTIGVYIVSDVLSNTFNEEENSETQEE